MIGQEKVLHTWVILVIVGIVLAACSSETSQPTPTTNPNDVMTDEAEKVVQEVKHILANRLQVETSTVSVDGVEKVQWPDACLGVHISGQMCAMHVVSGYRVILNVSNQKYEFHTNADGSIARPALALVWHREGGIAGFCDDLALNVLGEVSTSSCKGSSPASSDFTMLPTQQRATLSNWQNTLHSFTIEQTDPAIADAMTISLDFYGWGEGEVSAAQKRNIEQYAADVYTEFAVPVGGDRGVSPVPTDSQPSDSISIRNVQVDASSISLSGWSSLPEGTCIQTQLLADAQVQSWWPANRCAEVKQNSWQITVQLNQGNAPEQLDTSQMYELQAWQSEEPTSTASLHFDLAGPAMP